MIASSPRTLCRLENRIQRKALMWIAEVLVDQFIASRTHTPESLNIDFDATDDPLRGRQEGQFCHGYYDNYCYLPLYVFSGDELVAAYLSLSKSDANKQSRALLKLLVRRFRESWPDVKIAIRIEGGSRRWKLMRWWDSHRIAYALGLRRNLALERLGADWIERAERQFAKTGQPQRIFGSFACQPSSWDRPRRVIVKAEHTAQGSNLISVAPDFVGVAAAQRTYGLWWQRLAAICCAVAPPRGDYAGSFRECFARAPAAPRYPRCWWRHASGNSAYARNSFSGLPTFTILLPGHAHRAFARGFSPAGHFSPGSAQRRNIRLKPFSDRSLDCCASVLRPTVRRNTRGAARVAAAADRIRRRVRVIEERIDASAGRKRPDRRAAGGRAQSVDHVDAKFFISTQ
jgi:hypothetical protein